MDQGPRPPTPHLRVQLTLLGSRRSAHSNRSAGFTSVLRVGTYHFNGQFHPEEPLVPGGHAVHCEVVLSEPTSALPHLPAGAMFELWENGRAGYGMVLGVLAAR